MSECYFGNASVDLHFSCHFLEKDLICSLGALCLNKMGGFSLGTELVNNSHSFLGLLSDFNPIEFEPIIFHIFVRFLFLKYLINSVKYITLKYSSLLAFK